MGRPAARSQQRLDRHRRITQPTFRARLRSLRFPTSLMHLAEALMPREEAVRLAAAELRRVLQKNGPYYERLPHLRPDPEQPLLDRVRVDDAWYFVPFARAGSGAEPLLLRVNGLTRVIVVNRSF